MKRFFQKIILWTYIKLHTIIIYISIALFRTEQEILKPDPFDLDEGDKHVQRHRHHNPILEKFYAGQRDEKYVKDYYELLRKADKFKREANPHKYEVAAWKYTGGHYGKEDESGQKHEHFGFFDPKHKHVGKTLKEVLDKEFDERRLKDDDYELLHIFNNNPIEVGLSKVFDTAVAKKSVDVDGNDVEEYEMLDIFNKSKQFEFPIKVSRENEDVRNKIEQLTEFLHVKKIGFEHRILEFFIPLKFKTNEFDNDSQIFKEIIDITDVFVFDEYGEKKGFGLLKFDKRIIHNNTHEVIKFQAVEMEDMGEY